MVVLATASLAVCVWLTRTVQPSAFFSPVARAWEFAIGGIALLVAQYEQRAPRGLRGLASWTGLAAIVGTAVMLQGEAGYPGWRALAPVLGTAVILNSRVPDIGVAKILELPFMQWLGRLSYSWYLWHWPVLVMARAVNPAMPVGWRLACVGGSLGLAAATYAVVENPIRFYPFLVLRPALTLELAGLATVVGLGTTVLFQVSASREADALDRGRMAQALEGNDVHTGACFVGLLGTNSGGCVRGNQTSPTTAVLFGDSHAIQWAPAFETLADKYGWRIVIMTKPACPTARVAVFNVFLKRPYTECDTWREAALRRIVEMQPAAVVIANRQVQELTPGPNGWNSTWRDGSRKTLERLDSASVTTILLRDTPAPSFDVPQCLAGDSSRWTRRSAAARNPCALYRAQALDDGVFRAEQDAAEGLHHVSVLDLSDQFCDGPVCPPVKNGLIVYLDNSHINGKFARSIAPVLAGRILPLITNGRR
jgi:hypothetical protein